MVPITVDVQVSNRIRGVAIRVRKLSSQIRCETVDRLSVTRMILRVTQTVISLLHMIRATITMTLDRYLALCRIEPIQDLTLKYSRNVMSDKSHNVLFLAPRVNHTNAWWITRTIGNRIRSYNGSTN
jgi:hypothetical protein